jgi:hypothetical protein
MHFYFNSVNLFVLQKLLCGWAKANVLQLCRLVRWVAALLILLKRWHLRWLGGSFAKLGFSVGLCGFANVPPKAWAILSFHL